MSQEDDDKKASELFLSNMERDGVVIYSVKDGYMLGFKRARLQAMLNEHPNNEKFIILVQKPKMN